MEINKDTMIFGSFSTNPGNLGCKYFNEKFNKNKINAIYKSFQINSIENGIKAMKTLNLKGVGISMPFKQEVIKYIDIIDDITRNTGVCNTVINNNNKLYGYNTDYHALIEFLKDKNYKHMYILGNGGYSKTLQCVCKQLNIQFEIITRSNWHKINYINNDIVFNCTPLENYILPSNTYIDCITTSETGKLLAKYQAEKQYDIYKNMFFINI
jgi:shikimate dehydrogenase